MATTTLTTLRQEVMQELDIGYLIANGDITLAAGTITIIDARVRNANLSTNTFRNKNTVITRLGAASAADFYRMAGDLTNSTGAIAFAPNVSDTTLGSETVELWFHGLIAGKEILDAINRAMRDVFFDVDVALSHGSALDFDMALSTDTDWTDVGTPTTSAKSTTARRTPFGLRSYNLIADAANEGTQSATLDVTTGMRVKGFAIISCDSGTASFRLRDVTNSADADTAAITSSEETPQLMMQDWQVVSSSAREFAARLLGTVNPSSIFVNSLWLFKEDELLVPLPAATSEHFMAPYIYQMRPTGNQISGNIWNARSLRRHELTEGKDYDLQFHHPGANPYAVLFRNSSYFDWPMFVQARRPYSDLVTFSAETDSTTCPINLLKPRVKQEIIDTVLIPRGIKKDVTTYQRAQAGSQWERANEARPVTKEGQRRPWAGIPRA